MKALGGEKVADDDGGQLKNLDSIISAVFRRDHSVHRGSESSKYTLLCLLLCLSVCLSLPLFSSLVIVAHVSPFSETIKISNSEWKVQCRQCRQTNKLGRRHHQLDKYFLSFSLEQQQQQQQQWSNKSPRLNITERTIYIFFSSSSSPAVDNSSCFIAFRLPLPLIYQLDRAEQSRADEGPLEHRRRQRVMKTAAAAVPAETNTHTHKCDI